MAWFDASALAPWPSSSTSVRGASIRASAFRTTAPRVGIDAGDYRTLRVRVTPVTSRLPRRSGDGVQYRPTRSVGGSDDGNSGFPGSASQG